MNLKTDEQKQAYAEIMKLIENCENSAKINGTKHSQENEDKYNKVALLCIKLFKSGTDDSKITIEEPSKEKPFVGVTIKLDSFSINETNKEDFVELVQLADEAIFYGDEENYFHMTFYVNDIWTE